MKQGSIYTVGQVNAYIAGLFEEDFLLRSLAVTGEVSNVKYHPSGHIYFTLKDEKGSIAAVMFAGNRRGLSFSMKDGDKIVATGSISVYEKQGKYQLYAKTIKRQGEGTLYKLYEQLRDELAEMGMFDPMYKKPLPKYVKTIGIVTASTGAAVRDIIRIATRRNPHLKLILYPAKVQGEGAAESIASGIRALDGMGTDVLIVGRGGGSIEDLWAFNERVVAEAIFRCETPVISAVGHETDTTIADFVADVRASTPSAAAELAVYPYEELSREIRAYREALRDTLSAALSEKRQRVSRYETALFHLSPVRRVEGYRQALSARAIRLSLAMKQSLTAKRSDLSAAAGRLDALSPLKRLSAGYSFTETERGTPVKSIRDVAVGERLYSAVTDGRIISEIRKIEEKA